MNPRKDFFYKNQNATNIDTSATDLRTLFEQYDQIWSESDGYKLIRAYRTQPRKQKNGIERPAEDKIEWGWKVTLKNQSRNNFKVDVEYSLKDDDGFVIDKSRNFPSVVLRAGEEVIIQETSTTDYAKAIRATQSSFDLQVYPK